MAVTLETTLGDMTFDLFYQRRPAAVYNFVKLCKMKYYNFNLFHTIERDFVAMSGDPTGSGQGGCSYHALVTTSRPHPQYSLFDRGPRIKHSRMGLLSFVGYDEGRFGSQFFITLAANLNYLDSKHFVFGALTEGQDVLRALNNAICDGSHRPYQDIRVTHTVVLHDPFPDDPADVPFPSRSPSPSAERLAGGRIGADESIDDAHGKTEDEVSEMVAAREATARATILEMVGDLPDADMAPPENVLFVCKLNPVTSEHDLEIIFARFGRIKGSEVIRDRKTGDSLQYAFIEFETKEACEAAYLKMDNVLIDERRVHVDFSQSVSKIRWLGKGRGVVKRDGSGAAKKRTPRLEASDAPVARDGADEEEEEKSRTHEKKLRAHRKKMSRRSYVKVRAKDKEEQHVVRWRRMEEKDDERHRRDRRQQRKEHSGERYGHDHRSRHRRSRRDRHEQSRSTKRKNHEGTPP